MEREPLLVRSKTTRSSRWMLLVAGLLLAAMVGAFYQRNSNESAVASNDVWSEISMADEGAETTAAADAETTAAAQEEEKKDETTGAAETTAAAQEEEKKDETTGAASETTAAAAQETTQAAGETTAAEEEKTETTAAAAETTGAAEEKKETTEAAAETTAATTETTQGAAETTASAAETTASAAEETTQEAAEETTQAAAETTKAAGDESSDTTQAAAEDTTAAATETTAAAGEETTAAAQETTPAATTTEGKKSKVSMDQKYSGITDCAAKAGAIAAINAAAFSVDASQVTAKPGEGCSSRRRRLGEGEVTFNVDLVFNADQGDAATAAAALSGDDVKAKLTEQAGSNADLAGVGVASVSAPVKSDVVEEIGNCGAEDNAVVAKCLGFNNDTLKDQCAADASCKWIDQACSVGHKMINCVARTSVDCKSRIEEEGKDPLEPTFMKDASCPSVEKSSASQTAVVLLFSILALWWM